MCYNVASLTKKTIKYAQHKGASQAEIEHLQKQLEILKDQTPSFYQVSGFVHPPLLVFTNNNPSLPQAMQWGLVPPWIKDEKSAMQVAKQTLNARAETIFEKPAFRSAAKNKRCLIYLDAFFEHHHLNGKTYPFRITMKNDDPLVLAGLWEAWKNPANGQVLQSVSIVTTEGNAAMEKIHNNPMADGPRMPVILAKDEQHFWLNEVQTKQDQEQLTQLTIPFSSSELMYKSVRRILGKEALGNVPEVEEEVCYPDLPDRLRF